MFSSPVNRSRTGCGKQEEQSPASPQARNCRRFLPSPAALPCPACPSSRKRRQTCRGAAVAPCSERTRWAKCRREAGRRVPSSHGCLAGAAGAAALRRAGTASALPRQQDLPGHRQLRSGPQLGYPGAAPCCVSEAVPETSLLQACVRLSCWQCRCPQPRNPVGCPHPAELPSTAEPCQQLRGRPAAHGATEEPN